MSLFENDEYQWRETFFIFFPEHKSLAAEKVEQELRDLDPRYQLENMLAQDDGTFCSLTLHAPDDYAAMDISVVAGDEVTEQMTDLITELLETAAPDELEQIERMKKCTCRFDVYHFEQLVFIGKSPEDEEDDFMDPGAVLIVLQQLAEMCGGIVVDPQSNTLL